MPGQTVQTQIRLLLEEQSDQRLHCLQFLRIVWTHYSTVKPHSSNFRLITTNFLGVRIFRNFTVYPDLTDPRGELSVQGLHCLPFRLHLLGH